MMKDFMQHTLAATVTFKGIGLHSGAPVTMSIHPASTGHGIVFQRADLNGKPLIPVHGKYSKPTALCTLLQKDEHISVSTPEHVLSAMIALNIDNALITLDGPEVPLMDGSAIDFYKPFLKTGITPQSKPRKALKVLQEIEIREGDKWVRLIPDNSRHFQMTIDFDHPMIGLQTFRFDLDHGNYEDDVAPARTFGFTKDFDMLKSAGLIKGGSMDNAVVFDEASVANPQGLRFADEPARHKLLDAIGDLALVGAPIIGRYEGYKASHALNTRLVQAFLADKSQFEEIDFSVPSKKTGHSSVTKRDKLFSK